MVIPHYLDPQSLAYLWTKLVHRFQRKTLVIEGPHDFILNPLDEDEFTLPAGTYNAIESAVSAGGDVAIKIESDSEGVTYYFTLSTVNDANVYLFVCQYEANIYSLYVDNSDGATVSVREVPNDSNIVHKASTESITGGKTFTGNVVLGDSAKATTPPAGDNSTKVATTAFVKTVVSAIPPVAVTQNAAPGATTIAVGNNSYPIVVNNDTDLGSLHNAVAPSWNVMSNCLSNVRTCLAGKAIAATTLAGYGIADAKISGNTITLGSSTMTPLVRENFTDSVVRFGSGNSSDFGLWKNSGSWSSNGKIQGICTKQSSYHRSTNNDCDAYIPTVGKVDTMISSAISDLISASPSSLCALHQLADAFASNGCFEMSVIEAIGCKSKVALCRNCTGTSIVINGSSSTLISHGEPPSSAKDVVAPSWTDMEENLCNLHCVYPSFEHSDGQDQVLTEAIAMLSAEIAGLKAGMHNLGRAVAETLALAEVPTISGGELILVGAGAPTFAPRFIGQLYFDKTNKALYVADSVTSNNTGFKKVA